jgi:A/G-specific adenine glycosylase
MAASPGSTAQGRAVNPLEDAHTVVALRRGLLQWYAENKRPLAWRENKEPYRVWVSEIMLQQTRVDQMDAYYRRFLDRFPTLGDLAGASEEQVLKAWEGLGYYARARNMRRAAQQVAEQRAGVLPDTYEGLLDLPGIGPYTAAAVSSIAFDRPHPVLDGNVTRVLCRLLRIEEDPRKTSIRARLIAAGETLISPEHPGDFNQALMELGASVCAPLNPACELCPIRLWCRARQELDDPGRLPFKAPKKPRPHHREVAGFIRRGSALLVTKRPSDAMLGGLWELPGGRFMRGEHPPAALRRTLREQLGIAVQTGRQLAEIAHGYSHFTITLHAVAASISEGDPHAGNSADWCWAESTELNELPFDRAHRRLLDLLASV